MKKHISNFLDFVVPYLIIVPGFYLISTYCAIYERVKELYYIVFKIPYYKGTYKSHYYVKRTDR
jgi:hypothetical protein